MAVHHEAQILLEPRGDWYMKVSVREIQEGNPVLRLNGRHDAHHCLHMKMGTEEATVKQLEVDDRPKLPVLLGHQKDVE